VGKRSKAGGGKSSSAAAAAASFDEQVAVVAPPTSAARTAILMGGASDELSGAVLRALSEEDPSELSSPSRPDGREEVGSRFVVDGEGDDYFGSAGHNDDNGGSSGHFPDSVATPPSLNLESLKVSNSNNKDNNNSNKNSSFSSIFSCSSNSSLFVAPTFSIFVRPLADTKSTRRRAGKNLLRDAISAFRVFT